MKSGGPAHRFCIVFNPCAKGEKARAFREGLAQFAPGVPLKPTFAAGAATQLAREAVEEGFEVVVAAGGDGTVNEVLNGIAYNPKTNTIFVTGKNWSKMFEIKIKQ